MALLDLIDHITEDSKKFSLAIFLDLSKAFDTINHNIFIEKLQLCGIRGTTLTTGSQTK